MRHTLKLGVCAIIAASCLAPVFSSAQAEPINDQGLVRAFAEQAPNLNKVSAGGALLPPGMRQALSMDKRFSGSDPENERLSTSARRPIQVEQIIILTAPPPKEPRSY